MFHCDLINDIHLFLLYIDLALFYSIVFA